MTSFEQRREAWDAGIAAAARHHIEGAQLVSPFPPQSIRTRYFDDAARRTGTALLKLMEARP